MTTKRNPLRRGAAAGVLLMALTACGGSGGADPVSGVGSGGGGSPPPIVVTEMPSSRVAAARFLTQATFGPTSADVDRLMAVGYAAWIDEQFAKPVSQHRATWEATDAAVKAANPGGSAGQDGTINAFWKSALRGDDQLRQRVAFALSQIMVISMQDNGVGDNPRAVAAYLDLLADKGLGTYRELLEAVALHPMMGVYLSHLRNQKANPITGRVPDENFAREVMQLFAIGLHELNADGSPRQAGGRPVESYASSDIAGLAKVFTGWSWACPDWPDNGCFSSGSVAGVSDPDRTFKPMLGYPQYHSTEAKTFLATTIAAQAVSDPRASVRVALDTLAGHRNVGPFIGKQLIQRLVTSNPSPAYVAAVAAAFDNNGSGVRGDLKHVVKTLLMHPEARVASATSGKVREPVLRLSAFLRAFDAASDSGDFRVGNTDNASTSLGQTPLRSPSVFNFYRPGYLPPGTQAAAASLVVPEMQIVNETSVAGYVNYMRDAVASGVGSVGAAQNRRDVLPGYAAEIALSDRPPELVAQVDRKLSEGAMPAALKAEIEAAVASITIPALNAGATNQAAIDAARRNRVNAAVFLTLVSPEFQVQK